MNLNTLPPLRTLRISICGCTGNIVLTEPIREDFKAVQGSDLVKQKLPEVPSLAMADEAVPTFEQQYKSLAKKGEDTLQSLDGIFTKNEALYQEELEHLKACIVQNLVDTKAFVKFLEEALPIENEEASEAALKDLGGIEALKKDLLPFITTAEAIFERLVNSFPQSAAILNELLPQNRPLFKSKFEFIAQGIRNKQKAIQTVDEAIAYCRFMAEFFKAFGYEVDVQDRGSLRDLLHPRLKVWYKFDFSPDLSQHFFVKEKAALEILNNHVEDCEQKRLLIHFMLLQATSNSEIKEKLEAKEEELLQKLAAAQTARRDYLKTFPLSKVQAAIDALKALNVSIEALKRVYGEACRSQDMYLERDFQITINDKFGPSGPESDRRKAVSGLEGIKHLCR